MEKLNFKEILEASIANLGSGTALQFSDILIAMSVTLVCAAIVFYTYIKTYQGVLYQKSYNIALVMVSLITTLVIMTISGNLALSLGMVGALSIIRFRTAVKDPLDVVFMFWCVAIGIANGVAFFKISLFGSILIALVLFGLSRIKIKREPYLLIVRYDNASEESVMESLQRSARSYKLKTKTMKGNMSELTAEVRLGKDGGKLLSRLEKSEGITESTLLAYTNDLAEL